MTTAITVKDYARRRLPRLSRHAQRAEHQIHLNRVTHRPAHAVPRAEIQDRRQVQEAFARRDIRDVTHPHLIQRHAVDIELPGEPIRRDGIGVRRFRRHHRRRVFGRAANPASRRI